MVDIILATYNGEHYIREQLNSILAQSVDSWHLYIRDDASTDGTVDIIREYAKLYPQKIEYEVNSYNSGSPKANFFTLLKRTTAPIVMCCDQDDIWHRAKVERAIEVFKHYDSSVPLLLHTDLTVIDDRKRIISHSMVKSQQLDVRHTQLNKLLVQNVVTGCTTAMNRVLINILKEPKELPVHDWWIAAVASIFGKVVYSSFPSVYYRRHSSNVCGAQDMSDGEYIRSRFKDRKRAKYMLSLGYIMARELYCCYSSRLSQAERDMLKAYAGMPELNKVQKLATAAKYGIWKSGIVRKVGQVVFM
jgi:glycosyltransferase involved in cell wall biosynthesis